MKINREFQIEGVKRSVNHSYETDTILNIFKRNSQYQPSSFNFVGSPSSPDSLAVAIVGSRKLTQYGRAVIDTFVRGLVSHNITIVSGLMYGADLEAHKCAIRYGGRTIGVLGYGFKYLRNHLYAYNVVKDIIMNHCGFVLSEYEDIQPPSHWTFPRRNKTIVALSKATIVIEATIKSGTFITAGYTLDQNKPLFVVPGSIFNKQSIGTHKLIKDGGILVDSVDDVLDYLHLLARDTNNLEDFNIRNDIVSVLKIIGDGELSFDKIALNSKLSRTVLLRLLTKLELNGILSRSVSGKWYRL